MGVVRQVTSRANWPARGRHRVLLELIDRLHRDSGLMSHRAIEARMHLNRTSVGEILRGDRLPTTSEQAVALVEALGGGREEAQRAGTLTKALLRERASAAPAPVRTDVVAALAMTYRRRLENRSDQLDLGDGMAVPALYVPAGFRTARSVLGAPLSSDRWWTQGKHPVRGGVDDFLVEYLGTNPDALRTAVVAVGAPGAGKSTLATVLAARLCAADHTFAVRVELRRVDPDTDIQQQLEQAVYLQTGLRTTWPELCSHLGRRRLVAIFDGFDELLLAVRDGRAGFLDEIAAFQDREHTAGQEVAALVTTRTVVADRMRYSGNALVVRVEPFDRSQVEAWLAGWAATNGAALAARGHVPLSSEVALRQGEIARQPLLLLLLAIYDGVDNALHRSDGPMGYTELYENMVSTFARREVRRAAPPAVDETERDHVADELNRFSAIAVTMFNRGRQVITLREANADLRALAGAAPDAAPAATEALITRFYFVLHEARGAATDRSVDRSFEFMHATFADFFVARHVCAAASAPDDESAPVSGGLNGAISYALLLRGTLLARCVERAGRAPSQERARVHGHLVALFRAELANLGRDTTSWHPVDRTVVERSAMRLANLLLLALVYSDSDVAATDLFGVDGYKAAQQKWRRVALLWESQLGAQDWSSLHRAIRVRSTWDVTESDAEAFMERNQYLWVAFEDRSSVSLSASLPPDLLGSWMIGQDAHVDVDDSVFADTSWMATDPVGAVLRQAAFRGDAGQPISTLLHAMAPVLQLFSRRDPFKTSVDEGHKKSSGYVLGVEGPTLRVVLEILASPTANGYDAGRRGRLYRHYADRLQDDDDRPVMELVFGRLCREAARLPVEDVVAVLRAAANVEEFRNGMAADYVAIVKTLVTRLGAQDSRVAALMHLPPRYLYDNMNTIDLSFWDEIAKARSRLLG